MIQNGTDEYCNQGMHAVIHAKYGSIISETKLGPETLVICNINTGTTQLLETIIN